MRWSLALMLVPLVVAPMATAQSAPEQIHVTLGASVDDLDFQPPDAMSLAITWHVPMPYAANQQPQVKYKIDNGSEETVAAQVVGTTRDYTASNVANQDEWEGIQAELHYGALVAVPHGKNLTYQVGATGATFSDWHTTKMKPHPGASLSVVALSYIGYNGFDRATGERLDAEPAPQLSVIDLAANQTADLAIIPGNLAHSSSSNPWNIFMRTMQPLMAHTPTMPVPGSSDDSDDYQHLRERFMLPPNGGGTPGNVDESLAAELLYYGFSAGPVYFIGLNTVALCKPIVSSSYTGGGTPPCPGGTEVDPEQINWLKETLEDAREDLRATWIVVYMEGNPYTYTDDGPNLPVRQYLLPLLEGYNVDLVITGQEAVYERTYPLISGNPTSDSLTDYAAGSGPIFVNTGGGGYYLTDAGPEPLPAWVAATESIRHITRLDITNTTLSVKAIEADNGTVFDAFTIHKPTSAHHPDNQDGEAEPSGDSSGLAAMAAVAALGAAVFLARNRGGGRR